MIETLDLAGAFDCFADEIKREDFFETNNRDETFSEQLIHYAQLFQRSKADQAASLFDDFNDPSLATAGRPTIKPAVPWVDVERLGKERELVGMYLSAHPLDPYYMDLTYGATPIKDFNPEGGDHEEGEEARIGGMVMDFQTRQGRNGLFGILRMEDLSGSTELRLFGQQFVDFNGYCVQGNQIMVSGRYMRRYANADIRFNITGISLLSDERGRAVRGIIINLPSDKVNETLCQLVGDHMRSSESDRGELRIRVYDPKLNRAVTLNSGVRIPVNRKLIEMLESLDIEFQIITNNSK
ncbi:MAG: hypothetical protein K2M97_05735 [Muribaculaceae bacterium]|nr:hypothetical protein [Muribaculaceae bacterium]